MSRARREALLAMGLKFNGIYFVPPFKCNCEVKIRHDEVEELTDKAFANRLRYVKRVMEEYNNV